LKVEGEFLYRQRQEMAGYMGEEEEEGEDEEKVLKELEEEMVKEGGGEDNIDKMLDELTRDL
jgi:hypothetical protein